MKKAMSILLAVLAFCCVNSALGVTWNVPGDSATIQGGIDLASYGDTVQVAAGTYIENITLKNGVTLIGAGAATTIIDGNNSGSVVTSSSCDPNTVIDGFTITRGNAYDGGGMQNYNSSTVVTNCTFTGNVSLEVGGGMSNSGGSPTITGCTFSENSPAGYSLGGAMCNSYSSPVITGCTFINNVANGFQQAGTGLGGAMYNDYSSPVITGCTFTQNRSREGAGMYNHNSNPAVTDCRFIRNLATYTTGAAGMQNKSSSPTLTNCTFSGNVGAGGSMGNPRAGALLNQSSSNPIVVNCVFIGNWGIYGGGICSEDSNPTVVNCTFCGNAGTWYGIMIGDANVFDSIFWGNTAGAFGIISSTVHIDYSNVQGGWSGTGNINADPLFVRAPHPGADGKWGTADDDYGDLRLSAGSPCIDKGANAFIPAGITTDIDGYQRIIDGDCNDIEVVDMGAYEFNYAWMGDLDYNCGVDFLDFSIFAGAWQTQESDAGWNRPCDISNPPDNYIDLNDLLILCNNWLAVIP